jgi:hypothetical protein
MSLLSLCQLAAQSLGLAVPSTIVDNPDETATRLLGAAQDEGENLARRPENGWVAMITEYDFYTSATGNNIPGTIATVGGFGQISGLTLGTTQNPVAADTWYAFGTNVPQQAILTAVTYNDPNSIVTFNQPAVVATATAGVFTLGQSDYALPSDFERTVDNTMWDRSRFWSMRGPQSPQQWQLYKSSVIGRASIQRRFRFREINGNQVFSIDPVPTDNGSALVFEYVSNAWCKSSAGTKQTMWEADTDVGILDEYLMRLGVKWRMLHGLGMNYQSELAEYERQVSKAIAKDGGMAILDMTPNDQLALIGPWNLPETGYGSGVQGA